MGCNNCKEKKNIKGDLIEASKTINKGVLWFVIVWSLFALYGIYSFIKLL